MIKNQSPSRQEQTTGRALMYDEPLKAKVLQKSLAYYAQLVPIYSVRTLVAHWRNLVARADDTR